MKLKNIIISSVIISLSLSAIAEEIQKNDYYIQFNIGSAHGEKPKGNFTQGSLGNTGLYGIEAGYRINDYFRSSISLDYRPDFKNNYCIKEYYGKIIVTENYKTKIKSLVTMLNLHFDIVEVNDFTPYITLGAGISSNRTNSSINITNSKGYNNTGYYANKLLNSFAYKAGLGVRFSFSQNFDFDLHYQYANLGKFKTGSPPDSNRGTTEATKTGKVKSHEVLLGVAYKF